MTSFRSSRQSNPKDDVSAWSRLGLRRNSKRPTPSESCVSGNSEQSLVGEIPTRQRRFGGLRHLASDSHLEDRYSNPRSNTSSTSSRGAPSSVSEPRSVRSNSMAGMLDMDRSRNRPARTFVGNRCAVCEEPLEHTLRGERVLQFSCAHVSHEACFYEYIKEIDAQYCPECSAPLGLDSSRGGNVLDLEKLSSIVRSVSVADNGQENIREKPADRDKERDPDRARDTISTIQDEHHGNRARSGSLQGSRTSSITRADSRADTRQDFGDRDGHIRHENGHWRNHSTASGDPYSDPPPTPTPVLRRFEYESTVGHDANTRASFPRIPSPIPPPAITVRSEFPALTRSKAQQSLTCIVTVEVSERKYNHAEGVIAVTSSEQDPTNPHDVPSQYTFDRQHDQQQEAASRTREREYEREREDALAGITEDLRLRVENWHGLDFSRFGKLRLHGTIKVGKDCQAWQELECYLFSEMLICVKEKKIATASGQWANSSTRRRERTVKCTLKGSILIKKHLKKVTDSSGAETHILTLNLSVAELPQFHLSFPSRMQLDQWQRALLDLHTDAPSKNPFEDKRPAPSDDEYDDYPGSVKTPRRVSSVASGFSIPAGGGRSQGLTSMDPPGMSDTAAARSTHIPMDLVVVIPVSSSMQGLKIKVLRGALKFLVQNLGDSDRLGLVTFGSSGGGVPITGLMNKRWGGWPKVISSTRPVGQKSLRADVVEGANVAMDLLMQRKSSNPLASILLISDSSTSETEAVDFVVSRAEAAKITIHSFGLGLTHKPDTMIEISTRTKGLFTYVKDWTMLRECVAGCVGSLQTLSHQNAKLRLKLPEGSPARFVKISGALQVSKRASGREAEASLGDLRFGDKKDILVQLVISPDSNQSESAPQDAWESIVSGLEALGGTTDVEEQRTISIEEVPLIQADLTYGNIQRDGTLSQSRQHLLTITMLPTPSPKKSTERPRSPPIPPHPMVVQRRMELLTSDMLSRSLTLVSRTQHERAQTLLKETRTILRGLGKGALPPVPPPATSLSSETSEVPEPQERVLAITPPLERNFTPAAGIDADTVSALDSELESALEWISHPAIFSRDSRKSVLQAIGVISSQRGITFRTPCESLYAERIEGIKRLAALAREWQDADESLQEED